MDDLQAAAVSLNREAAQAAVTNLKADIQTFRDEVRESGDDNDELNQAAGDLSGAVDGLETTLREASQGTTSITGIIQELRRPRYPSSCLRWTRSDKKPGVTDSAGSWS